MNLDDPLSPEPRRRLLLLTLVATALVAALGFGEVAPSVAIAASVPVADETGATSRPATLAAPRRESRRRTRALPTRRARRGAPHRPVAPQLVPAPGAMRRGDPPRRGPPTRRSAPGVPA